MLRFFATCFLLGVTGLGVWLASSLVAYAGGPAWLACVGGVLLFPVLPLWWEKRATDAFYAQLKRATRLLPKKRTFTAFTRVALRTVFINVVFVAVLLVLWPKVAFAALATRGDWFLGDAQGTAAAVTRKVLISAASGLEWIHEATHENPYRKPEDSQQPVPDTVKPVVAVITTPSGSGARWRRADPKPDPSKLGPSDPDPTRPEPSKLGPTDPDPEPSKLGPTDPDPEPSKLGPGDPDPDPRELAAWTVGETTWPQPARVHPVVLGMTAADETSPEAVARYIAARVTDPFQRVKALHDWLITRLRYDSVALQRRQVPPQDAQSVFLTRIAVCEGYARLFIELGRHTGDRIAYVTGETREESGEMAPVGHAWNAVEIRGAWYLVDVTWDDPVMTDGTDAYLTDYLFIPAQLAVMNHLPDEPRWQLRPAPMSRAEFLRQPVASIALARERLELKSPLRPVVDVADAITVELGNPARNFVMVKVMPEGTRCGPSDDVNVALSCPVTRTSQRAVVFVNHERDGTYGSVASFVVRPR